MVAVKVMLSRVDADDAAIGKFKRDVAVTAGLGHPNIIRVLDSGAEGTVFYFIMEFCDDGSVRDPMLQNKGRLTLTQAKPIILATAAMPRSRARGRSGFLLSCRERGVDGVKWDEVELEKEFSTPMPGRAFSTLECRATLERTARRAGRGT